MGKPIMVVGTSSGAGKSLLCAAICRILSNKGYSVAPFKMQNMSLNSICSVEGGEMSIAQYIQSIACRKQPSIRYNPLLLKPEKGQTYVVFEGNFTERLPALSYMTDRKRKYFEKGIQSLKKLLEENDYVIIEGAGSPAEVNLKKYDIVNMAVAKAVNADTILVTDIDRGGSFASITGTMEIFTQEERNLVKGFVFNKFRGNASILDSGFEFLFDRYSVPTIGIIPMISHKIPEEDSLQIWENQTGELDIRILKTPFISNFSDFTPLSWYNGIKYVESPEETGGDILIIPGSKRTIDDLEWIRENRIDDAIKKAIKNGTFIMGICGGFQMMGESITDNFESRKGICEGLGILPIDTVFSEEKITGNTERKVLWNNLEIQVKGYEIRHGKTKPSTENHSFFSVLKDEEGKSLYEGSITENALGTYLHGIFYNDNFTREFLNYFRKGKGLSQLNQKRNSLDEEIERWAKIVSENLNLDKLTGV